MAENPNNSNYNQRPNQGYPYPNNRQGPQNYPPQPVNYPPQPPMPNFPQGQQVNRQPGYNQSFRPQPQPKPNQQQPETPETKENKISQKTQKKTGGLPAVRKAR